jgi:hypothetical protein
MPGLSRLGCIGIGANVGNGPAPPQTSRIKLAGGLSEGGVECMHVLCSHKQLATLEAVLNVEPLGSQLVVEKSKAVSMIGGSSPT